MKRAMVLSFIGLLSVASLLPAQQQGQWWAINGPRALAFDDRLKKLADIEVGPNAHEPEYSPDRRSRRQGGPQRRPDRQSRNQTKGLARLSHTSVSGYQHNNIMPKLGQFLRKSSGDISQATGFRIGSGFRRSHKKIERVRLVHERPTTARKLGGG